VSLLEGCKSFTAITKKQIISAENRWDTNSLVAILYLFVTSMSLSKKAVLRAINMSIVKITKQQRRNLLY